MKECLYLGYMMGRNNGEVIYIEYLAKKAKAILGKVWGLGERLLGENWEGRMKLFEVLVRRVMSYGAEIWGWKEREELERVQERYLRWCLKVDGTTPAHVVRRETGVKKNNGEGINKGSKVRSEVKGTGRRVKESMC